MYKIRIHGRGGQGGKTAAQILGEAAFIGDKYAQDFSIYGAERRGAPVASFVRIDTKEIWERGYIHDPDCIIILDDAVLQMDEVHVFDGIKKQGLVIVNSKKSAKQLGLSQDTKNVVVDASSIAMKILKKPMFNTVMLGAFAAASPLLSFRDIVKALEKVIGKKKKELVNVNILAIKECYDEVKKMM